MTTKDGRPFGKFKLEDYNGSHEFLLYSKDYETFRQYIYPDYFLFIRGKVQQRSYSNPPALEYKITSMTQLSEMKDSIKEIHITLPISDVKEPLITRLGEIVHKSKGKAVLYINLYDSEEQVSLNMYSRKYHVSIDSELTDFLDENDLKYKVS